MKNFNRRVRKIKIGRTAFAALNYRHLFAEWDRRIRTGRKGYACFCEAHLWVLSERNRQVASALSQSAYVLPDGVAITHAGRLFGRRFPARLPGPQVLLAYCRHGLKLGHRHFFYGGAPGVAEELAAHLQQLFPGLQVAGCYCPPFRELTETEEQQVTEVIDHSQADVVWVGLGAPKQELWMQRFSTRLQAPLLMGVGAAFDFHTGRQRWAPRWIRRIGFEWLFRALTGGKKTFIRYIKHVPMFLGLVIKARLFKKT